MNGEKSVLRTRLGGDTQDHIMRINVDDPSLHNFDTEKHVFDWIESTVTSRHLNGHNSSRTEKHEEADENVIFLYGQNRLFASIFFSYLDDVKLFLALIDMNYLIIIIVENTIEASY